MNRHQLDHHPLIRQNLRAGLADLSSQVETKRIIRLLEQLYNHHSFKPFDAIVGDDVSGRGPTLIAHRFLRLAHTAGHIGTVPRTFFLSSGKLRGLDERNQANVEEEWQRNLTAQARLLSTTYGLSRAALITEIIGEGVSIKRMKKAFSPFLDEQPISYDVGSTGFYCHGFGCTALREMLGVEKYPPLALSERHPHFNNVGAPLLRSFLNDYASFAFSEIFDESAPEVTSVDRSSYAPVPNVIKT